MEKKRLQIGFMARVLVVFILLGVICACSSTPTIITQPNVNFSKYKYACIMGIQLSGYTQQYYAPIQDTLLLCGYNVITEERIRTLSADEQSELMLVSVGYVNGTFTIGITDYLSGGLLVSCKRYSYWLAPYKLLEEILKDLEKIIKK